MSAPNLSIIILTYNENLHIERCIKSCLELTKSVYVVDSHSTDNTVDIATSLGATVIEHKWENNHARQFNWALDNIPLKSDWVMRLDADEYLSPGLTEEIKKRLVNVSIDVNGFIIKRRVYFSGKWIRYGGYYPIRLLRIWRSGYGRYENKWMDEHVILNTGRSEELRHDFIDDNKNLINWWTDKHNNYSTREAVEYLCIKYSLSGNDSVADLAGNSTERKRWLKENIYYRLPMFIRPFLYYLYRYFFKLGFLDGKEGLIFHFLQGFWYRFLVDVKIFQIEKLAGKNPGEIRKAISEHFKINV